MRRALEVTARWFTDVQTLTAHSMAPGGNAACTRKTWIHWSEVAVWKPDLPPGYRICPKCEKILAGERLCPGRCTPS